MLEYPGGIPTSLIKSGHQWDFPNAWPPLVVSSIIFKLLYLIFVQYFAFKSNIL